ncbi:MAG TPA: chemotaxis protein CheW, partial [Nitrososphaera sp.]|nr:chemotaxis protein CheW [Nitrososphaera sp.]
IGEKVVIDVSDDGRGIDLARVRAKAAENGIISKDEADSMSDNDVITLIGTPGLSTSSKVTDVSGRGVGMDVVFDKIEAVGGQVRIQTSKDKGTTITLVIPLSLAIIGGLVVTIQDEKYVIPISNVVSVLRPEPAQIKMVNGQEVITMAEKVIPLVPAVSILGLRSDSEPSGHTQEAYDKLTAVMIDVNGKLIALTVDSVESKQDIVVKHVHKAGFETESMPSDATILPDGNVALVLDSAQLQERIK